MRLYYSIKVNKAVFIFSIFFSISAFAQTFQDEINLHREKYKQEFLEDDHSPFKKKEDLEYIRFFNPTVKYKVKADFVRTENATPIDLATMNGLTKQFIEYGTLSFTIKGKKLSLKIFQNTALLDNPEYKDHLFLPFTDKTNGNDTYDGGRYLDFKTSDIKEGHLILDFNKTYNPYCAYSAGYSCPRPPEENNIPFSIKAGEKKYGKSSH